MLAVALGLAPGAAIAAEPQDGVGSAGSGRATAPEGAGASDARTPAIPAASNAKSPFKANRLASKPLGLTPDQVGDAFEYPNEPVVLSWSGVAGAVDYEVEVASSPGFSRIMWRATTDQTNAVPEVLLPDGTYWWRVTPIDAAGTRGLPSESARFVKTWPNRIGGLETRAEPVGSAVSFTRLNPYMRWNAVPGAKSYEVDFSPADQFGTPNVIGRELGTNFATPGAAGILLPDDVYRWRVRARDAADNPGPWTTSGPFTKAWQRAEPISPADSASTDSIFLTWAAVEGADKYQVQISQREFNWVGDDLKVNAETSSTALSPTDAERLAKGLSPGDFWWRVRPMVGGTFGGWSPARKGTWLANTSTNPTTTLSSSGDSDSNLMPHLSWTSVAGAGVYRVDIAADQNFNQILESVCTNQTGWASRTPLPDNQVGTGYHWRVVWGAGIDCKAPLFMVDEDLVPTATVRKQTRIVTAQSSDGIVSSEPLVRWDPVPGAARYALELSKDAQFGDGTQTTTLVSTGGVPGNFDKLERLAEGTWHWRVRAVDGGGNGQSWSPVRSFTINRQRPVVTAPRNGQTVVRSPRLGWDPIPQACAYHVQIRRDRNFEQQVEPELTGPGAGSPSEGQAKGPEQPSESDVFSTYQTSWTPTSQVIDKPGIWYWRVRADFCGGTLGQWTPLRAFRSVKPPDFNLNTIPTKLGYGYRLTVAGRLVNNGTPVKRTRIHIERRFLKDPVHRVFGTVRTDARGRFAFSLPMRASASWRLVWREGEEALAPKPDKKKTKKKTKKTVKRTRKTTREVQTAPNGARIQRVLPPPKSSNARPIASEDGIRGQAPFAVNVTPRVTLKLGTRRVVRKRKIKVTGSVFPRRPAQLQVRTSDGWETVRRITPRRSRFGVRIRANFAPGRHQVRLLVPSDKRGRLALGKSRRKAVLVYDRFVVR